MGCTIPQLNTCCFVGTLRIGTIILLILHLIFSLGSISGVMYQKEMYDEQIQNFHELESQVAAFNIHIKQKSGTEGFPTLDKLYPFGYWGAIIMNAVTAVFSIAGLYGVYKKTHPYLIPYLVWEIIYVLSMIGFVLVAVSWRLFFAELIPLTIYGYFWLVVFSYFRVLKQSAIETNPA